ncbi:MAG: hypothetical protein JXB32_06180 [Deltaproteobacteria bacterium]|nr:hypothetical protein [Deltaproteobacteria bacterium]
MTRSGLLLFAMLLAGCGSSTTLSSDDGGADTPADVPGDVPGDVPPDVPADIPADSPADVPVDVPADVVEDGDAPEETDGDTCPTWRLLDVTPEEVTSGESVAPWVGRTVRLRVTHILDCQQRRAMPEVTVQDEARRVLVRPRVWDTRRDCMGPAVLITRWIPVSFPSAGTWTIESPPGTVALTVEVDPRPTTGCDTSSRPCDEDCDCGTGQACLSGWGLGGPFTACAAPCEEDLDCRGGGSCIDVDDGFDRTCDDAVPQCGTAGRECPFGFACDGGTCRPDYTLGSTARVPCACATDCTPPLLCAEPTVAGGTRRCEFGCPTGGAWCPGAHVCGDAADDLSGLAGTDSVCGWLGD